jgi:hypothetical protein
LFGGVIHRIQTPGNFWQCFIKDQFPVIVALPMAGLGALFVTLVLRISSGPIEFEVAGLKFKGGSAPNFSCSHLRFIQKRTQGA